MAANQLEKLAAATEKLMKARQDLHDVCKTRTDMFGGEGDEMPKLDELMKTAQEEITRIRNERAAMVQKCGNDTAKLAAHEQATAKQDVDATNAYTANHANNQKLLTDNQEQQKRVWENIQGLYTQLETLGTEQEKLLVSGCNIVLEEVQRKHQHDKIVDMQKRQKTVLEKVAPAAQQVVEVVSAVEEFLRLGKQAVLEKKRAVDAELRDMKIAEAKEYAENFRNLYMMVGEEVHRAQTQLTELGRMRRSSEAQLSACAATLDPNKKMYEDMASRFGAQEETLGKKYAAMQKVLEESSEAFKPVQAVLHAAGQPVAHPKTALHELNLHRTQEAFELQQKRLAQEQREMDARKAQLQDEQAGKFLVSPPPKPLVPPAPESPPKPPTPARSSPAKSPAKSPKTSPQQPVASPQLAVQSPPKPMETDP
eukprot:NODE_44_length_1665_cov_203.741245_g41_i0.p1 GENE.NODE_44_length_1665_cov_203.741245_g41_i0~~NODE_44_length_1665_cov_203.741245_g41_i0.p1  ORF type:complete len:472 (+),score=114.02 NODE_44_length_1665_cov_203.741245_g41_i0:144-1418(+)